MMRCLRSYWDIEISIWPQTLLIIISKPNYLLLLHVSNWFINVQFLKKLSKKMICLNSFLTSVKGKLAGGETWRERKSQRWEMGVHLASYILWLTLCLFQDRLGHNATRRRMMDCMCVCKRERSLSWWH